MLGLFPRVTSELPQGSAQRWLVILYLLFLCVQDGQTDGLKQAGRPTRAQESLGNAAVAVAAPASCSAPTAGLLPGMQGPFGHVLL